MNQVQLKVSLRQMLAVLESERLALAGLDLDAIVGAAGDKQRLCGSLDAAGPLALDEEARAMLEAAQRLNELNRQVRNLIAANVSTRLNAMTGRPETYRAKAATPRYAVSGYRA